MIQILAHPYDSNRYGSWFEFFWFMIWIFMIHDSNPYDSWFEFCWFMIRFIMVHGLNPYDSWFKSFYCKRSKLHHNCLWRYAMYFYQPCTAKYWVVHQFIEIKFEILSVEKMNVDCSENLFESRNFLAKITLHALYDVKACWHIFFFCKF